MKVPHGGPGGAGQIRAAPGDGATCEGGAHGVLRAAACGDVALGRGAYGAAS